MGQLLRYEEAAARLGISNVSLRSLVKRDELKSTRVGLRGVRIDEDEIKRYVESSRISVGKS